jgi:hypothetical protein
MWKSTIPIHKIDVALRVDWDLSLADTEKMGPVASNIRHHTNALRVRFEELGNCNATIQSSHPT